MAIESTDLKKYLTGAASNGGAQSDPNASLGNYRSSTEPTSAQDNNLFDDVSGPEALAGHTDYRCLCFRNEHGSLSLTDARIFFSADDANADTTYSIAIERPATAGATTGNAQSVGNETTAPTVNTTAHNGAGSGISNWVASSTANSYANGVSVAQGSFTASLAPNELIFVWIRRVIGAAAGAASAVSFTIRLQGDSAA